MPSRRRPKLLQRETLDLLWHAVSPDPERAGVIPEPTPPRGPDPYGSLDDPAWMKVDWREHLRSIDLSGARINLVDVPSSSGERSDAPALLFVHGLAGAWQNWLENIPRFAERGHRVIAPDLPGFGGSPMPSWEISIERYGVLIHELLEDLGIERCVAVGNSMGGFVAAEAVITGPEPIEKLVLVSAAGVSSTAIEDEPAETFARLSVATAPALIKFTERGLRRPRLRYFAFRGAFHHPDLLRPELLAEQHHSSAERPGFADAFVALCGYDILDRLEEVEIPSLIVWGRDDRIVPSPDAAGFSARLPDSRTEIFAETGHLPMLERPLRFNRVVEEFVDGVKT